jgi:hypothetical protein
MASRLPALQGPRGGADGRQQRAILAVCAMAAVRLGQLAASGPAELQVVPIAVLLVPQPADHWLQRMREAHPGTLIPCLVREVLVKCEHHTP